MVRRYRYCPGIPGYLIAMIALVSQLALGAMVLPDDSAGMEIATLDAVSILCGQNHAHGDDNLPPEKHRPVDLALCPLSATLALPAIILTLTPVLQACPGCVLSIGIDYKPPGRGPPLATARVGAPRAPPSI